MNILTEPLNEYVTIDGKNFGIHTDFRTWIKFSLLAFSNMSEVEKLIEAITLVYKEMPDNLYGAVKAAIDFYNPVKRISQGKSTENKKRVYDFDYDADMVYSAFFQQYGIDLSIVNMHWWKFKALFDNLSEDTAFVKALQYRSVELSTIKDKEQRKLYQKMKKLYALPDSRSEEQKEQEFSNSFVNSFI